MKNNMQRVIGNIVILTPVIVGLAFYKQLPNQIAIHFNVEEQANGFMDRNLAIVALPFLALVIYNLLFSYFKQITIPFLKEFMLWLVPISAVLIQGLILTVALGGHVQVRLTVIWLLALIFLVIGNYLPKTKQNNILGIRLPWTLKSESCWNKTHRFSGKVWVLGGIVIIISAFLQMYILVLITTFAMIIISIVYSYLKRNE